MKTALVVAGVAPGWVRNQIRIAAEALTEDGRVLIAMSDDVGDSDRLPGSNGNSTLFGVARSGYPLWTGRMSSVLGLRRRQDRVVLVRFDGDRHILLAAAALMGRLRREQLVIHDLSITAATGFTRRTTARFIDSLPHSKVERPLSTAVGGPSIALVVCGADTDLARLAVSAAQAMSTDAGDSWRLIVQADDPCVETLVRESGRTRAITSEPPGQIEDLIRSSDVIVVRDGAELPLQHEALAQGAALVLVGHPLGGRMSPRFDGAWLVRSDVSSIIVALEYFRESRFGGPAATDGRSDGLRLVETIRAAHLASA